MSKKVLTLAQRHGYSRIVLGTSFIISAACYLLTNEVLNLIGTILYFICSVVALATLLMKSEQDDERSVQNLTLAGESAFNYLMILALLFSTVTIVFKDLVIDYKILIRLVLGTGYILYGYFFLKYEKEGY